MESTTLDQAVESLLSPAPENTGGDNLSEAVDQITEPEDDDQGEEIEAVAESDDDAEEEASSEQDDEEYDLEDVDVDDEDPQEATEEDVLYSVKYKASGSNAKKPSEAWVFDEALLQMKEVKVGKYTLVLITSDSN